MKDTDKNNRLLWLDVTRVVAIVSVVFNHALSRSFSIYQNTQSEFVKMSLIGSFAKALLYVFSRLGVPLFLMVSGALLIKRDYEKKDNLNRFLRHNWFGLFRTTEIWLIIMFLFLQFFSNSAFSTGGIWSSILRLFETLFFINQETMGSMWYMAMILIVYLMIPVVSIGIKRLGDRYIAIICSVGVIIGMILPNIRTTMEIIDSSKVFDLALNVGDLFSVYLLYIIFGYWISEGRMSSFKNSIVFLGFTSGLILTSLFQLWVYVTPTDYSIRYADIGILITSIFLFEIIRRGGNKVSEQKVTKTTTYLSRISFGVYFVHICVMTSVNVIIDNYFHISGFLEFAVLSLSSFIISIMVISILSRNKIMGKYLFLIKD